MPGAQCCIVERGWTDFGQDRLYLRHRNTAARESSAREARRPEDRRPNWTKTMLFWAFLLKRYRAWRTYRETYNALADLDVRARADIGVSFLDIETIARRAAMKAAA